MSRFYEHSMNEISRNRNLTTHLLCFKLVGEEILNFDEELEFVPEASKGEPKKKIDFKLP